MHKTIKAGKQEGRSFIGIKDGAGKQEGRSFIGIKMEQENRITEKHENRKVKGVTRRKSLFQSSCISGLGASPVLRK